MVNITPPPKHDKADRKRPLLGLLLLLCFVPIWQNLRKSMGSIPSNIAIPPSNIMERIFEGSTSMFFDEKRINEPCLFASYYKKMYL